MDSSPNCHLDTGTKSQLTDESIHPTVNSPTAASTRRLSDYTLTRFDRLKKTKMGGKRIQSQNEVSEDFTFNINFCHFTVAS